MKKPDLKRYLIFLITTLIGFSCNNDRLDVNLSDVELQKIEIKRLDLDLFSINPGNYHSKTIELTKKYGEFYETFVTEILNPGNENESIEKAILSFVSHPDMKEMNKDVQKIYNIDEIQLLEDELNQCFKYFKFHFPNRKIPKEIVAFQSGFNYNITTADERIGIGLEMYLGTKNKFYSMLQWPQYKVNQLDKHHLVSDAMKGWIIKTFDENQPLNNLLGYMVYYGKMLYTMDAMLPETPDSIKIGYSNLQISYCTKFEKKLWAYFSEKDRLFKNDMKHINEYISEGPFTSAISKDCPPRIAMWMGWQIVRSYMNKNKNITLDMLMKEKDSQKILFQAKYKP